MFDSASSVQPAVHGSNGHHALTVVPATEATASVPTGTPLTTRVRRWLDAFLTCTASQDVDPRRVLIEQFKGQYRFLGLRDGERYELQILQPELPDPGKRGDLQRHRFAYTDSLKGGLALLYKAAAQYGYQGLYVIPQTVNPAALSKAAPDRWHLLASGSGTSAKDIAAFLISYADFDAIRDGGAKKISATLDELMLSCERGIQFMTDAAEILGSDKSLGFLFSGNGCQGHVALDRLPHTEEVQQLRTEFVHVVTVLYSNERVVGDDAVCNPNRLCPAAGTSKRKGHHDIKLGRVHRLTGMYCADEVERLSLDQFRGLVEGFKARLTDEQHEQLSGKTKNKGKPTTVTRATSTTSSTTSSKKVGPSPFELANAIPIREVYRQVGQDPSQPKCPGCGADDTTAFLDDKLGVQSMKCQHATCGARSWKNIDLVVALVLGRDLDDQDARREAVNWLADAFPTACVQKLRKGKAAFKTEVDAHVAENPTHLEDLIGKCSSTSTDDDLRDLVTAINTRDAAPASALLKSLAKKTGIKKSTLVALTNGDPEIAGAATTDDNYSDAEWPTKLRRNKYGVLSTFANAITVMTHDHRWKGRLAWCEFTNRIVLRAMPPWSSESSTTCEFEKDMPWKEADDHRLVDYMQRYYGITISPKQAYHSAFLSAEKMKVHPVREYLDSLVWDGIARLDQLLATYMGTSSTPYTVKVGPWFMIQAVKRVFEPGCQADYVLVLEGEQGIKKSSAIKALCPNQAWVSDTTFSIGTKDAMIALRGRLFIELAEAASLLKAEHAASKAFFTSRTDDYRPPYGQHNIQVARQCVVFGTINPEGGYLRDPTGNRRYWPVACGTIDLTAIERDRDQLWAEAATRYHKGERCYPDHPEDHTLFTGVQEQRGEQDAWSEPIEAGLAELNEVTVAYVLTEIVEIKPADQNQQHQNRSVKVLTALGWRLRGVEKITETDSKKIEQGKLRKSVRIYTRSSPIENAFEFEPGMSRAHLESLKNIRESKRLAQQV